MSGLFKVAGISTALREGWVIPEKTFVYDLESKKYFFGDGVTVGGKTFEALSASEIVALLNGLTGANRLSSDSLREGTVKNFYTRVASTTALTSLTGEIPIAFVTENNTWYKYDASSTATPDGVLIVEVTAGGRFIAFAGDKFLFDDAKKIKTSFLPAWASLDTAKEGTNTDQMINSLVLKGFMSSVLNGFETTGRLALYEDSLALLNYNCDKSLSASTTDVPTDFAGIGDCSTRIGANSNDDRRQIIYGKASQNGYIWYRSTTAGVYGSWNLIVGTEYGSNSSGSYIKFADGLLICSYQKTDTSGVSTPTAYGSTGLYRCIWTWTYPHAFITPPEVTGAGADNGYQGIVNSDGTQTTASSPIYHYSAGTGASISINNRVVATGRWK